MTIKKLQKVTGMKIYKGKFTDISSQPQVYILFRKWKEILNPDIKKNTDTISSSESIGEGDADYGNDLYLQWRNRHIRNGG